MCYHGLESEDGAMNEKQARQALTERRKAVLALTERTGTRYLDLVVSAFGSAHGDVPLREACARALRAMGPAADQTRDTLYRATVQPTVKGLLGELKEIGGPR